MDNGEKENERTFRSCNKSDDVGKDCDYNEPTIGRCALSISGAGNKWSTGNDSRIERLELKDVVVHYDCPKAVGELLFIVLTAAFKKVPVQTEQLKLN